MTSPHVPDALAKQVRERATDRCEYCRLSQAGQEATFHIDHVYPRRLGGETKLENLALACVSCSLRKGGAIDAVDPETEELAPIFDPRREQWSDHFTIESDGGITGLSATGRATMLRLRFNRALAVSIRSEEMERGRYQ